MDTKHFSRSPPTSFNLQENPRASNCGISRKPRQVCLYDVIFPFLHNGSYVSWQSLRYNVANIWRIEHNFVSFSSREDPRRSRSTTISVWFIQSRDRDIWTYVAHIHILVWLCMLLSTIFEFQTYSPCRMPIFFLPYRFTTEWPRL